MEFQEPLRGPPRRPPSEVGRVPPRERGYLAVLQAALRDPQPLGSPISAEARAEATQTSQATRKAMGTGIDRQMVAHSLDGFSRAIQLDPTCVPAYLGLGRAVILLARARPNEGMQLLSQTISWLVRSMKTFGPLQDDKEIHELEIKLRNARQELNKRPKMAPDPGSAQSAPSRAERDAEGRVLRGPRRVRFKPSSSELRALIPSRAALQPPEEEEKVSPWLPASGVVFLLAGLVGGAAGLLPYLAVGVLVAMGLLVMLIPVLVWVGRQTGGIAPLFLALGVTAACVGLARQLVPRDIDDRRYAEQLTPRHGSIVPLLQVGDARTPTRALAPLAVVRETGLAEQPFVVDRLHERLAAGQRADPAGPLRQVVVARRFSGHPEQLLLLWIIDLETLRLVARTALAGPRSGALDLDARDWLTRLGQLPPPDEDP